jgi:hypothetical protein
MEIAMRVLARIDVAPGVRIESVRAELANKLKGS